MESKVQYTASPPSYAYPATGQPPAGYPPQPAYITPQYGAPPPQQQQQQTVVVVGAGQQQPVVVQQVQSYVGHIIFACLVLWFCNWVFGLIAFILAMVASSTAVSDPGSARRLGRASYGMSIAGIVVTVVVIIIVVATVNSSSSSSSSYSRSSSRTSYSYGYK